MNEPPPADTGGPTESQLRVYQLEDGSWTWCWVEAGTGYELHSNSTFPTPEAAAESARHAYPGVAVVHQPGQLPHR